MKRILITGAGGFVGSRILRQLGNRFDFVQIPKQLIRTADEEGILRAMDGLQPNAIIHAAAISDTTYSQEHSDESYVANVLLPVCMAKAAKKAGAKLIAFSSDQVYTGQEGIGPFDEVWEARPTNVYGQHKLEAEKRVLDILPEAVLLRATWMYDLPGYGLPIRSNMVMNLLKAALWGNELTFSAEDYRGITYVRQVVDMLVPALELPGGVYNFGSENAMNMYETAVDAAAALGLSVKLRKETYRRSLNIDCGKLKRAGILFDNTQEGIRRMKKDYYLDTIIQAKNLE